MRLICPNCDAQYEVPTEVIPDEGRDVQCSNCRHTWFQAHPDYPVESTADTTLEDEEVLSATTEHVAFQDPEPNVETSGVPNTVLEADETPAEDLPNETQVEPEARAPSRRELDPAVADVLRAEAELEAQARRNEAESFESQPDLGLGDGDHDEKRRARESRERMARIRGEDTMEMSVPEGPDMMVAAPMAMGSRRDLLPDIEEINSTLRSNTDRSPAVDAGQTAQIEAQERRKSRLGFTLTVLLFTALALIYVFSEQIAAVLPPVEPAMTAYASTIDGLRDALDARLQSMLNWLDEAASSSGG